MLDCVLASCTCDSKVPRPVGVVNSEEGASAAIEGALKAEGGAVVLRIFRPAVGRELSADWNCVL
jgi:hypothetical protein